MLKMGVAPERMLPSALASAPQPVLPRAPLPLPPPGAAQGLPLLPHLGTPRPRQPLPEGNQGGASRALSCPGFLLHLGPVSSRLCSPTAAPLSFLSLAELCLKSRVTASCAGGPDPPGRVLIASAQNEGRIQSAGEAQSHNLPPPHSSPGPSAQEGWWALRLGGAP